MPFPEVSYDPNDPYAYLGATAGSYEQPTQAPTVATGGYLPWAQDSYASQAGYAVESPEWNRVWALEQQYRSSPELYAGQSFFDWLGSRDPQLAQAIRNPATEAYDQRMRLLASQGQQRYGNIESDIRDLQNGGPVAQAALLLGAGAGTAGLLAGGGAAGGAAAGGGSATTYPVTTGGLAAGPITATPIAGAGAAAAGSGLETAPNGLPTGVASGAGTAGNVLGAVANGVPDWVSSILLPAINAGIGTNAANNATDAILAGNQAAIDESKRQYDTTRTDLMPWLDAGKGALTRLQDPTASFMASPDYGFVRSEGLRDIENLFSAKSGAKSGNALRALDQFNTNLASGEFGNWWNRQAGLAGLGQTTGTQLGTLGANNAATVGSYYGNSGDARASGILGRGAVVSNSLTDALNNLIYSRGRRNSLPVYGGG